MQRCAAKGGMKALKFAALWVAGVLSFAGYGFWGAYGEARELHFVDPLGFTLEPTVG